MTGLQASTWQDRAGVALVLSGWHRYGGQPFATDLLCALMREYREVAFVVAFDGYFYDPCDNVDAEEARTLSLWVVARYDDQYGEANRQRAKDEAPAFVRAWIAGWQARHATVIP